MTNAHDHEFLSFGDALFLYLERDEAPLNIASVSVFDGAISIQDFTRFVESKLPSIPRYLQRVVFPAFHLGLPWWDFDQKFDIRNHVRAAKLKHGTEAELKALAGKLFSETLDRSHPLWNLTLVSGLKNGKTGLIARVHHSLADGLSGVSLLNALLDASPDYVPLPYKRIRIPKPAPRDPAMTLVDGVLASFADSVQRILGAHSEVLRMAERVVAGADGQAESHGLSMNNNNGKSVPSIDEVGRMMPELLAPTDKMPFNVLCQGPQKFEWTTIPFAEVRAIKHACGATVNDVLLAVVGMAFRHYAQEHGIPVKSRALRIVVPVSTRTRHDMEQLGNQITFVPVNVPLGLSAPEKVIGAVHERTQMIKGAHIAEFAAFSGTLMGTIPAPLQVFLSGILSRLPLSLCNIICTNVPGPKVPLYMLGHKMETCYPHVPIGGEMGVNCAVLTYDGHVFFGFAGDEHAIPDLEKLPAFVNRSFEEMRAAIEVPVAHSKQHKQKPSREVKKRVPRQPRPKAKAKVASAIMESAPSVEPELEPVPAAEVAQEAQPFEETQAADHQQEEPEAAMAASV